MINLDCLTCKNCENELTINSKFCPKCGHSIIKKEIEGKESNLNKIIAFYISVIFFIIISYFINNNFYENFIVELITEICFAFIIFIFCIYDLKAVLKLYKLPKLSISAYLLASLVPIISSFIVYFSINSLNTIIDPTKYNNYYINYLYLENPLLWSIIFVSILPPVFEELAFRGYLYNIMKKVTNDKITIIATSFLFALIHFSFISLLWIFPFGLFLGYLRKKYNTLWLCMIAHFIHNFIVLMLDYYTYNYIF